VEDTLMRGPSSPYAFIAYRSSRAFFWASTAQHLETRGRVRDLIGAAAMLLGIVAWGGVFVLLAG